MRLSDRMVLLGFDVESGDEVRIPIRHMCVTGQTQEAGKTTTLEALIARSELRALTFITKRGEGAFAGGLLDMPTQPYFREQADWRFVSSMLEAFLGERLKFERSWIMRASKGARTLADVRRNVVRLMEKAKGLNADVYMVLSEYLDELVPAIAAVKWAPSLRLVAGVNVMDLTAIPGTLQHLVIRSAIEWVLEKEEATVVVVPEAWKFIPEGRRTPVSLSALSYIRQGAGLRNYLWLDSQDIGGVAKEILRSVPVWILGVQREANEIKRTLSNIPASIAKPKAADIATLELGEFVACWGKHAIKTYVQPAGMPDATARAIATGHATRSVWRPPAPRPPVESKLDPPWKGHVDELEAFVGRAAQRAVDDVLAKVTKGGMDEMNPQQEKKLDALIDQVGRLVSALGRSDSRVPAPPAGGSPGARTGVERTATAAAGMDVEELYQAVKRRLISEAADDPQILTILIRQPELRVKVERHTIEVDGDTLRGRLALLIAEGFFDQPVEGGKVFAELGRRGFKTAHPNVAKELGELARMGFLTRSNKWYQAVAAMKSNVVGV